ncbi:hypothetical protein Tco_0832943 [Tanacetum coccineum]
MISYCLITGTEVDIGEIIYSDLVTKLLSKSRLKYISYPRFISCALQVLLGYEYTQDKQFRSLLNILSNSNFSKDPSQVTDIELTGHMIAVNNQKDSVYPHPIFRKKKKVNSQTVTPTLPKSQGLKASGALSKKRQNPKSKKTPTETQVWTTPLPEGPLGDKDSEGFKPPADMEPINPSFAHLSGTGAEYQDEMAQESDDEEVFATGEDMDEDTQADEEEHQIIKYQWKKHEEVAVSYADLMASIEGYYKENVDHRDQTDTLVQSIMNYLDKNSTKRADLLKALNRVTETLKFVQEAIKDDPTLNKKVFEATEAYTKNYTNLTKLLTLVKSFDFHDLMSIVESLKATTLSQDKHLAEWANSSTSMAWNLGSQMANKCWVGGNVTHAATEEPPSHTKGENDDIKADKEDDPIQRLIPISMFRPLIRVNPELEAMTSPSTVKLVDIILKIPSSKSDANKEDEIKKAIKKVKQALLTRTEVIKVVQEKAEKIRLDPKTIFSAKAGEKFKKAQDVHSPFKFSDFEVTKLDELGPIIQKKKNTIVKDLMTSLGKRYERLKKIPEELGIQSTLPAPIPKQAPSQS